MRKHLSIQRYLPTIYEESEDAEDADSSVKNNVEEEGDQGSYMQEFFGLSSLCTTNRSQNANDTSSSEVKDKENQNEKDTQDGTTNDAEEIQRNVGNKISSNSNKTCNTDVSTKDLNIENDEKLEAISNPHDINNQNPEQITKTLAASLVNNLLQKCIQNHHQQLRGNSRLSNRGNQNEAKVPNSGANNDVVTSESDIEKKISAEKECIERENDHQFGHGDNACHDIVDMETVRRQRMERLQHLREVLEQKKTERQKELKEHGTEEAQSPAARDCENITETADCGVDISKVHTHLDVLSAPRMSIKSIYREVECFNDDTKSDVSENHSECDLHYIFPDHSSNGENESLSISDLESKTSIGNTPVKDSGSFGFSPNNPISSETNQQNNTPQNDHNRTPFDRELSNLSQKEKNTYEKLRVTFRANKEVPDAEFWKELNNGEVVSAKQFLDSHYGNKSNDLSGWKAKGTSEAREYEWKAHGVCEADDHGIFQMHSKHTNKKENACNAYELLKKNMCVESAKIPESVDNDARKAHEFFSKVRSEIKNSSREDDQVNKAEIVKVGKKKKKKGKKKKSKGMESEMLKYSSKNGFKSGICIPGYTSECEDVSKELLRSESPETIRRRLRDAENMFFFKQVASSDWFYKNKRLTRDVNDTDGNESQLDSDNFENADDTKMFSRSVSKNEIFYKKSNSNNIIPDDPKNYISAHQAEENLKFFRYISRNPSFFKRK